MDAFSALSANLAPTAPSPSTNVASSSNSTKPFASHLQTATKQQRAGQRSEAPASQTDALTGQATDATANQPHPSQNEPAHEEPAATDNSTASADATTTAGATNAAPPALPAQPAHGETHLTTNSSSVASNAGSGSTMTRLLDAIAATTPAAGNGQAQESKSTPAAPTISQSAASVTAETQPIVDEKTVNPATASPVTPSLTATTEPLPASSTAPLPTTLPAPQLPGQASISQDSLASQSPTIVVQSAAETQTAATVANGQSSLPQSEVGPDSPLVVQNQYGQIITIQQNTAPPVATEAQTAAQVTPFVGNAEADMDLNNQYIHSHLPNETATKGEESGNRSAMSNDSGQSMPQNQTSQQAESPAAAEPMLAAKTLTPTGQESQSLIFSHQQSSGLTSAPLSTSTTGTAEGSLYRLASGNTVPETAVVDQMIAHFSMNKRLESGTINLRLHPQELGELRMEIKVEQDNVKAHIVAQSPHAQEMIDRHLPKLREALEQQGLHLNQVEVTVAANDNAAGEAFQENTAWQQSQRSQSSKQSHAVFTMEDLDEEIDTIAEIDNNLSVIA